MAFMSVRDSARERYQQQLQDISEDPDAVNQNAALGNLYNPDDPDEQSRGLTSPAGPNWARYFKVMRNRAKMSGVDLGGVTTGAPTPSIATDPGSSFNDNYYFQGGQGTLTGGDTPEAMTQARLPQSKFPQGRHMAAGMWKR